MRRTTTTSTPRQPNAYTQEWNVLQALKEGSRDIFQLSSAAGYAPDPSIRRAIGTLRRNGFTITNSRGLYTLQA